MEREGRSPFKILPQAFTTSEVFTLLLALSLGKICLTNGTADRSQSFQKAGGSTRELAINIGL
jgi:hypothetical protein